MKLRDFLSVLLVTVMVGSILVSVLSSLSSIKAQEGLSFEAGTYTGVSEGFGGKVEAIVTVSENAIKNIQVIADSETAEIGGAAIDGIIVEVIATQSLAVDVVSGATMSSDAILEAISDALVQAGANIEFLKDESNKLAVVIDEQEDLNVDVVVIGAGYPNAHLSQK